MSRPANRGPVVRVRRSRGSGDVSGRERRRWRAPAIVALAVLLGATGAAQPDDDWASCLDERALGRVSCPAVDDRCVARCMVAVNIDLYLEPTFDLLERFRGRDDEEARKWRSRLVRQLTFMGFLDATSHLSDDEIHAQVREAGLARRARSHLEELLRVGLAGDRLALYRRFLLGEGVAAAPPPAGGATAAGMSPRDPAAP